MTNARREATIWSEDLTDLPPLYRGDRNLLARHMVGGR